MAIQNSKLRMITALLAVAFGLGVITPAVAAPVTVDRSHALASAKTAFDAVDLDRHRALFPRHAILRVMPATGASLAPASGSLGLASVSRRFNDTAATANGLQIGLGVLETTRSVSPAGPGMASLFKTPPSADLAAEMSYSSAFVGGMLQAWVDARWQTSNINDITNLNCASLSWEGDGCADTSGHAWGIGSKLDYRGFALVGYVRDGQARGRSALFDHLAPWPAPGRLDAYFVQGTYAFSGKTKVGVSYGDGNLDGIQGAGIAANTMGPRLEHQLWTVGVYHDVSSWLRLIAEYNHSELSTQAAGKQPSGNSFSVGSFLYW